MERLDKRLAATGQWSRKEAKELIRAGRVCVQGQVCQNPEEKVGENTPVWVDGAAIGADTPIYLMLHKPAGVVSATEDEQEKTVLDLPGLVANFGRRTVFPFTVSGGFASVAT